MRSPLASRTRRTSCARGARKLGRFERLEARNLLTSVPFGATPSDTGEYMLGDVYVNVVFIESMGGAGNDPSTENWSPALINSVKSKIETGVNWWVQTLHNYYPAAELAFNIDFTYATNPFPSKFEPINRTSDQHALFVDEFLKDQNISTSAGISTAIRAYNHAQRVANDDAWSFTIFVVNDELDTDKAFAAGGQFSRSFAFSGGRYFVTLSDRPAEIIAHELGHMFWAVDEYAGGASYGTARGYYNTLNSNGVNGHPQPFVQQPSIMAEASMLQSSWLNHTLAQSTREMIGWKDTDGDGILDVHDVPLELNGIGYLNSVTGKYDFVGTSRAKALPNRNSIGTGNDMTLNRVSVAEYRTDGGAWLVAETFDAYSVELNLSITLPAGTSAIEIRTRDTSTGAASAIFSGTPARVTSTTTPGVNGFVWNDLNASGQWDAGEKGLPERTVHLLDSQGQPLNFTFAVEPGNHSSMQPLVQPIPQVSFAALGDEAISTLVTVMDEAALPGNDRVFANYTNTQLSQATPRWKNGTRMLRMNFSAPVSEVSIDARAISTAAVGRIDAYDSAGNIIGRYSSGTIAAGQLATLKLTLPTANIAYAIAYGNLGTEVLLDNLVFGVPTQTTTDAGGAYRLPAPIAGDYRVQVVTPEHWSATAPASSFQPVSVSAGQTVAWVDFGQHTATLGWQNPANPHDVNNDGEVTPLDALLLIIEMNERGAYSLGELPGNGVPPLYYDVSGDALLSPLDPLLVINLLNSEPPAPPDGGELPPPEDDGDGEDHHHHHDDFETDHSEGEAEVAEFVRILTAPLGSLTTSATDSEQVPQSQPPAAYSSARDHLFTVLGGAPPSLATDFTSVRDRLAKRPASTTAVPALELAPAENGDLRAAMSRRF